MAADVPSGTLVSALVWGFKSHLFFEPRRLGPTRKLGMEVWVAAEGRAVSCWYKTKWIPYSLTQCFQSLGAQVFAPRAVREQKSGLPDTEVGGHKMWTFWGSWRIGLRNTAVGYCVFIMWEGANTWTVWEYTKTGLGNAALMVSEWTS